MGFGLGLGDFARKLGKGRKISCYCIGYQYSYLERRSELPLLRLLPGNCRDLRISSNIRVFERFNITLEGEKSHPKEKG